MIIIVVAILSFIAIAIGVKRSRRPWLRDPTDDREFWDDDGRISLVYVLWVTFLVLAIAFLARALGIV